MQERAAQAAQQQGLSTQGVLAANTIKDISSSLLDVNPLHKKRVVVLLTEPTSYPELCPRSHKTRTDAVGHSFPIPLVRKQGFGTEFAFRGFSTKPHKLVVNQARQAQRSDIPSNYTAQKYMQAEWHADKLAGTLGQCEPADVEQVRLGLAPSTTTWRTYHLQSYVSGRCA